MSAPFENTPLSVGRVTLAVRDLERAAAFYREVVGLAPIEGEEGRVLLGAGGRGLLELLARPGAAPEAPGSAGLFHTAFLLPSRRDLARWLAHARSRGVALEGAGDHIVSEALYLSDPEGNGVEIYADRDPAGWPWKDGQVEMATLRVDIPGLLAEAGEAPFEGMPEGTRIGHVHLRVGDIGAAEAFYLGRLGMARVASYPGASFVSTGGYHHHLGLNVWGSAGAGPREEGRAGLVEVELLDRREGARPAILRDPWGTRIRLAPAFPNS